MIVIVVVVLDQPRPRPWTSATRQGSRSRQRQRSRSATTNRERPGPATLTDDEAARALRGDRGCPRGRRVDQLARSARAGGGRPLLPTRYRRARMARPTPVVRRNRPPGVRAGRAVDPTLDNRRHSPKLTSRGRQLPVDRGSPAVRADHCSGLCRRLGLVPAASSLFDAPVLRVATPNVPIPYSPVLEAHILPSKQKIEKAVMQLIE